MSRVTTNFYLHRNLDSQGKNIVFCRITYKRKKAEFATSFSALPSEWNNERKRFKRNELANDELTTIESKVVMSKQRLYLEGKEVSARALRDLVTERRQLHYTLLQYHKEFVESHRKAGDLSESAFSKYLTSQEYLEKFLKAKYRSTEVSLKEVDFAFIDAWDQYLKSLQSVQFGRKLAQTTINKYHDRLKTVLKKALYSGLLTQFPYQNFKLPKPNVGRKYLKFEELQRIVQHGCNGNFSLLKVKDIFLFTCYTGLRFQDAQKLTLDNIKKYDDGGSYLELMQRKTGNEVEIPLLPKAIEIIKNWDELPERKIKGQLLPQFSNVKVNEYLKIIQDFAEIEIRLTHNTARHTFATQLREQDVAEDVIASLLGHSGLYTVKNYSKLTSSRIRKSLGENIFD